MLSVCRVKRMHKGESTGKDPYRHIPSRKTSSSKFGIGKGGKRINPLGFIRSALMASAEKNKVVENNMKELQS